MKLLTYTLLLLLAPMITQCSRYHAIKQRLAEQTLKERVTTLLNTHSHDSCDDMMQMFDRWFRENVGPEYRQGMCQALPLLILTNATVSFRKITFSDDLQAAIVEITTHYATGETPYDGMQRWIHEHGDWYCVHQYSEIGFESFVEHFSASKNFDPSHPAFNPD